MISLIEFHAMGCQFTVQLAAAKDVSEVLARLPEQVAAIEARLTRFEPDSELMRFNAQAGDSVPVSAVLFENINAAKHAARMTDGRYNPLVLPALIANGYDRSFEQLDRVRGGNPRPAADWRDIALNRQTREVRIPAGAALDLGGCAKGWTAAHLADELGTHGPCLVNAGGDMVAKGAPDDLPGWPVEIEDPFTGAAFATLYLRDRSIATSGTDYRRWQDTQGATYHHIIDPHTGRPAGTDAVSVTVIHPQAITAEAYTKAVLLRGTSDGLRWLNQQWNTAGLVFRRDGAALASSTFTTFIYERHDQS